MQRSHMHKGLLRRLRDMPLLIMPLHHRATLISTRLLLDSRRHNLIRLHPWNRNRLWKRRRNRQPLLMKPWPYLQKRRRNNRSETTRRVTFDRCMCLCRSGASTICRIQNSPLSFDKVYSNCRRGTRWTTTSTIRLFLPGKVCRCFLVGSFVFCSLHYEQAVLGRVSGFQVLRSRVPQSSIASATKTARLVSAIVCTRSTCSRGRSFHCSFAGEHVGPYCRLEYS